MLYYLFNYLDRQFDLAGAGLFQYSTFRAAVAFILSLLIILVFGKKIIYFLQKRQIGEVVRDLGLHGQIDKKGTPTMGGLIIIAAILIPVILLAQLDNIYVQLIILATLWMGGVEVILGGIVGAVLYFNDDVRVKDFENVYYYEMEDDQVKWDKPLKVVHFRKNSGQEVEVIKDGMFLSHETRSLKTNVPLLKDNLLDYSLILKPFTSDYSFWGWLIFIPVVIFILTAVSNAANLTDGIDGLATGTSAIVVGTLALFAFVSGNIILADYLNILYIPMSGEMLVVCAAVVGACIGFLWYNTYPAIVFMGDTGSLMLGGLIATMAIILRKELLIPILCGIFLAENLSVMMQVAYFKYTRKRFGEGRRIFKMAPLHHHYQKLGYPEPKIVTRFLIISILLAVVTIITLKVR
jgi:phospho-N-acetylmuramoyl-pentapeptide-transferase